MNLPYRSRGEGSSTGAAEHALALEADWCRNAYGARQSVHLHEMTRSLENSMRTMISVLCTGDGAGLALRTSRVGAKLGASSDWSQRAGPPRFDSSLIRARMEVCIVTRGEANPLRITRVGIKLDRSMLDSHAIDRGGKVVMEKWFTRRDRVRWTGRENRSVLHIGLGPRSAPAEPELHIQAELLQRQNTIGPTEFDQAGPSSGFLTPSLAGKPGPCVVGLGSRSRVHQRTRALFAIRQLFS